VLRAAANASEVPLSTAVVYTLTSSNISWASEGQCVSERCSASVSLRYYRANACQAKVSCSSLGSSPCGSYGVSVRASNASFSLCRTGQIYSLGELDADNGIILMSVWKARTTKAPDAIRCHAWCTKDGNVPSRGADDGDAGQDYDLDNLVSTWHLQSHFMQHRVDGDVPHYRSTGRTD